MNIKFLSVNKSKFRLLSKTTGMAYEDYIKTYNLPDNIGSKGAAFVDEVIVGKFNGYDDIEKRKILTFKDNCNRIIKRIIQQWDHFQDYQLDRVYKYYQPEILDGISITGREITERLKLPVFNIFRKLGTTKIFVAESAGEKLKSKVVTIGKVEKELCDRSKEVHSLTEYPMLVDSRGKTSKLGGKKFYKLFIKKDMTGMPEIKKTETSPGVTLPENDSFFAMRLYDSFDLRKPITRKAIKDRGFEKLNTKVSSRVDIPYEWILGSFFEKDGFICFNGKDMPRCDVITTAFHKTEHMAQAVSYAMAGKTEYPFYRKARKLFGLFRDPKKIARAEKLYKASNEMYKAKQEKSIEELIYTKMYKIIENPAKLAGKKGEKQYYKQQEELLEEFPFVLSEEM